MAKRIKLPKRIAGVKIPKGIRKGPVIGFLNTPAGQVVLAQALLVIGGAFAVDKARDNDAMLHPLDTLKDAKRDLLDDSDISGTKLTRAFVAAAHAFRDVLLSDDDDDRPLGNASGNEPIDATAEGSRKKSRVRSEPPSTPH
jgi:hypothetical protein